MQFQKTINKNRFVVIGLLLLALFVSSCKTTRNLPVYEVKPMSTSKILKKVDRQSPNYNTYEAKKISFDCQVKNESFSFSGQLKNQRDRSIILSLRKMSLPVGKGLITTDSLTFINYFDKSFLTGNFEDIKDLLGAELDFSLIQSLFTANLNKVFREENLDKEAVSVIDSQMYRIDYQIKPQNIKKPSPEKEKRYNRYLKKVNNSEFTDCSLWVDPQDFVIRKLILRDKKNNNNITIRFDQFETVGKNLFPQHISLESYSQSQRFFLTMKLSKSSVNSDSDFSFSIPENFKKSKLTY